MKTGIQIYNTIKIRRNYRISTDFFPHFPWAIPKIYSFLYEVKSPALLKGQRKEKWLRDYAEFIKLANKILK